MGPGDHGAQAAQIVRNLDAALAAVGATRPSVLPSTGIRRSVSGRLR
ncbi:MULTISPECIES: RidA family protein [Streptomyces]|nr:MULTISPECIES: RidA family protein [Streptomyces]MDX3608970.1 RidA family protein [Streptomyces sp. FL06-04B]MDX3740017.1 RidA family protein [Streptomyces sp. ID01-15D]